MVLGGCLFSTPGFACGRLLADTADWPEHQELFRKQGLTPESARAAADRLKRSLDTVVLDWLRTRNTPELWEESRDGARLKGTGYVLVEGHAPKGANPYLGWARTEAQAVQYADLLAPTCRLTPGEIRIPPHRQRVEEQGKLLLWEAFATEDRNHPALYEELALLSLEEQYHLVQYLRRFAGLVDWTLTGKALDREADVFAHFVGLGVPLRPSWAKRYPSRAALVSGG